MKYAFFADTPFQVMNCINFVWHNLENSKNNSDLYIHKRFPGYPHIVSELENLGIFNRVIQCNMPVRERETVLIHYLKRCFELLFPKKALYIWCSGQYQAKEKYSAILASAPLPFVEAVAYVNKGIDIWFYDDGSGSYFGNIIDTYNKKFQPLLYLLTKKGVMSISPSRLYVNNVDLCASTLTSNIFALPHFDTKDHKFISALNRVFENNEISKYKRIVYISQPFEKSISKRAESFLCRVLDSLAPYNDNVIVRPHPSEENREYYNYNVDRSQELWELKCVEEIDDNHILIGVFSTAQLTPKLLFDKEPYVIFLYHIYQLMTQDYLSMEKIDTLVNSIKASYRSPDKILVPTSFEDLSEMLQNIL